MWGKNRVSHGENAQSPIPWQVSLRYENYDNQNHVCGGTILDSKTILTAAHCIFPSFGSAKIVAGAIFSNVSMSGQDGVQIRNAEFFNHPDYYNFLCKSVNNSTFHYIYVDTVTEKFFSKYFPFFNGNTAL